MTNKEIIKKYGLNPKFYKIDSIIPMERGFGYRIHISHTKLGYVLAPLLAIAGFFIQSAIDIWYAIKDNWKCYFTFEFDEFTRSATNSFKPDVKEELDKRIEILLK